MKLTWSERGFLALWYFTLLGIAWCLARAFV